MIRTEKEGIVIIFAKAPDPGAVKTRLQPILTVEERSGLQTALLRDTLHLTDSLRQERALACAPEVDHPFFVRCSRERPLSLVRQQGENLGERMKNALAWGFGQRFRKVVLIGSDAPTLPADFIQAAFDRLDRIPVVIGPSLDGGYYLIGARPPLPDLFDGIGWGGDQVLVSTLHKINAAKLDCHLLPFWYDIDRPNDLTFLKEQLDLLARQGKPVPKETSEFLRTLSCFHDKAGR
ncbi:MAG: TIGR04282 family arsenosugar biosynthesis glycosyltransferase [Nitrospirae bacterium]|nr:TIGR04282 family arsenosugar biosynthesis glycosyltransferase [Candidatus Manganitrophaceae bacterium]